MHRWDVHLVHRCDMYICVWLLLDEEKGENQIVEMKGILRYGKLIFREPPSPRLLAAWAVALGGWPACPWVAPVVEVFGILEPSALGGASSGRQVVAGGGDVSGGLGGRSGRPLRERWRPSGRRAAGR